MNFPFRHGRKVVALDATMSAPEHVMDSDFVVGLCRFTLTCSCGATFDTPYIDEALELRELHESLAPLADQLAS
ncbi:MAG: hypothetical protein NTX29_02370 [Actinobacteria bacterium]|nr:hypothetical protein [Actinomycetota bacterium]